jgi:hypothetical protein
LRNGRWTGFLDISAIGGEIHAPQGVPCDSFVQAMALPGRSFTKKSKTPNAIRRIMNDVRAALKRAAPTAAKRIA